MCNGFVAGDDFLNYKEYELSQPKKTPKRILKAQFKFYDKLDGETDDRFSLLGAARLRNIFDSNSKCNENISYLRKIFINCCES